MGTVYSQNIMLSENVVFEKKNTVSMSRSNWLATFVIDLLPFESVLDKISTDITDVFETNKNLIAEFRTNHLNKFAEDFMFIGQEIEHLNDTLNSITNTYFEYKTLYKPHSLEQSARNKRAVFDFVGDALSFLFGSATNAQIENIRGHVKVLAKNQKLISHIVKESLTILNITRTQVIKNKQSIYRIEYEIGNIKKLLINHVL